MVGLDPKQIIEMRDLIRNLAEKHTVILSSHILSASNDLSTRFMERIGSPAPARAMESSLRISALSAASI